MGAPTDGPDDSFGVFKEPVPLYKGEPYVQDPYQLSRHKGRQLAVPFPTSGSGPAALLDSTTKLTVPGDKYIDPHRIHKHHASTAANISSKPFMPVGVLPKPSGLGSMFGLFGTAEQLVDTDASTAARAGKPSLLTDAQRRRNIYISPAKKGTYGFPLQDRSIGGTCFDFVPDEYCPGRAIEKGLKRDARAKFVKPFVATGVTGKALDAGYPAQAPGPDKRDARSVSAPPGEARRPWKCSSPPQKGPGCGTLSPIVYIPNPTAKPKRHGVSTDKPFRPVGQPHARLSMWAPNPYQYKARDPPDNSVCLLP